MSNTSKHDAKAPKPIVELAPEVAPKVHRDAAEPVSAGDTARPADAPSSDDTEQGALPAGGKGFQQATVGFFEGFGRTVWAYANEHPHATLYGLIGFVLAVLVLVIGLWDTIVIAIFVGVGIVIGQMVDGDNALVNCMRRWLDGLK